jgi:uncharacterized metal-binding protein
MSTEKNCACSSSPTLIFACSGAADVGEISDRSARQLMKQGAGKMFCLAGIGGQVSGILKSTQAAEKILAIDGCPLACAKKSLDSQTGPTTSALNLPRWRLATGTIS